MLTNTAAAATPRSKCRERTRSRVVSVTYVRISYHVPTNRIPHRAKAAPRFDTPHTVQKSHTYEPHKPMDRTPCPFREPRCVHPSASQRGQRRRRDDAPLWRPGRRPPAPCSRRCPPGSRGRQPARQPPVKTPPATSATSAALALKGTHALAARLHLRLVCTARSRPAALPLPRSTETKDAAP